MGSKPGGDMRKFFVGEGGVRWCGWPVMGLGGVDVRGVVLLQKTRRPKGGVWTAWGTVSVHAGLEGRVDALAGGAANLDAIKAQLSSLSGTVFMAQRHVDSIGEGAV